MDETWESERDEMATALRATRVCWPKTVASSSVRCGASSSSTGYPRDAAEIFVINDADSEDAGGESDSSNSLTLSMADAVSQSMHSGGLGANAGSAKVERGLQPWSHTINDLLYN